MKTEKIIRVLVVDDEGLVRKGIVSFLSSQNDLQVVGEARDGIEAINIAVKTQPDVILLDMDMPRQDGLTTIPMLQEQVPNSRVLALSSITDASEAYQAIKLGVLGFYPKDVTHDQLLQALYAVANGQATIHPTVALKVINDGNQIEDKMLASEPLSQRELEALDLIARGMTDKEIAVSLNISIRAVKARIHRILEKLQLFNRTQAALYAIRENIVSPSTKKTAEPGAAVFISYARVDIGVVEKIYQKLKDKNHQPWIDIHSIKGGENWLRAITKAIDESEIFLAILSNNSVSRRGVIQKELKKALDKWDGMLPDDIYLIPIRIDDCPIPDLLKHIQVLDWDNGKGETRLLEAISVGLARRKDAE